MMAFYRLERQRQEQADGPEDGGYKETELIAAC